MLGLCLFAPFIKRNGHGLSLRAGLQPVDFFEALGGHQKRSPTMAVSLSQYEQSYYPYHPHQTIILLYDLAVDGTVKRILQVILQQSLHGYYLVFRKG
jgi:hypothetical protein